MKRRLSIHDGAAFGIAREIMGLSVKDMAAELHVSSRHFSSVIKGKNPPSLKMTSYLRTLIVSFVKQYDNVSRLPKWFDQSLDVLEEIEASSRNFNRRLR